MYGRTCSFPVEPVGHLHTSGPVDAQQQSSPAIGGDVAGYLGEVNNIGQPLLSIPGLGSSVREAYNAVQPLRMCLSSRYLSFFHILKLCSK